MKQEDFIKHACEQVLRFSRAKSWNDLSEEHKVQVGFNMGAMALGLSLSKDDGFLALANTRLEKTKMSDFHSHLRDLASKYDVSVDEAQVDRPF